MPLNFPILVGAALADSVNPVVFGILLVLLSSLEKKSASKKVTNYGLSYTAGFFLTSLLLGYLLLPALYLLSQTSSFFYPLLGSIIATFGIAEIAKHLRPKHRLFANTILNHNLRKKRYRFKANASPTSAFLLGTLVCFVEIPFSRGIYLATLSLLHIAAPAHSPIIMLAVYNIILIIPLVLITLTAKEGLSTNQFKLWQQKRHSQLHLGIGSLLTILGLWLIIS